MSSVENLLRDYARTVDRAYGDVGLDELTPPGVPIVDGLAPAAPPPRMPRWLIAVAAAVIVLVLLGGLTWLLTGWGDVDPIGPPDQSLIEREFEPVPPFTATYAVGDAIVEVSYGAGFRFVVIQGRPDLGNVAASGVPNGPCEGGMVVWDGSRLAVLEGCEPDEPGFAVRPTDDGFDPLGHLAWQSTGWWAGDGSWRDFCAEVAHTEQPAGPIAGRPIAHISCTGAGDDLELWVDATTGVILKLAGSDGAPAWPADFEAIAIDYDPAFAPETFAIDDSVGPPETAPPGALDVETIAYPVEPFGLSPGETVDPFAGPLLGGGTFDLAATRGTPVLIMLWADWCPPCTEDLAPFQEVADHWSDRVTFVTVLTADSTLEAAAALVEAAGLSVPVVIDETNDLWRAREAIPKYLLIGADGTALAGWTGMPGPGDLEQMLEQALS